MQGTLCHRLHLLPVGQRPPPRPLRQRQAAAQLFDGKVMDSHTANDGSKYIRVLFGSTTEDDPVALIDAEFSFPAGKLLDLPVAGQLCVGGVALLLASALAALLCHGGPLSLQAVVLLAILLFDRQARCTGRPFCTNNTTAKHVLASPVLQYFTGPISTATSLKSGV